VSAVTAAQSTLSNVPLSVDNEEHDAFAATPVEEGPVTGLNDVTSGYCSIC
jgi:hypothetical protein